MERNLEVISQYWLKFPTKILCSFNFNQSVVNDNEKSIFVYSVRRILKSFPRFSEISMIETGLTKFKMFEFKLLDFTNPVGYAILPLPSDGFLLRYTPKLITYVNEQSDFEKVKNCQREVLYGNGHLEALRDSLGSEIITSLGYDMRVSLIHCSSEDQE